MSDREGLSSNPVSAGEGTPPSGAVNAAPGATDTVALPRRPRSRVRRVLAMLTRSSALLAVAGVVAAASVVPPIGARRTAREAADQELRSMLGPDETVVASVFASQRRWTDVWRESFGMVAATSRRVLYVGAPPTPLLRPREDGPMELLIESYPYERSFVIEPRDVFFGQLRGLALRTPLARVDFLISSDEWSDAAAVAKAAQESQRQRTIEQEDQERFNRAPAPPAEVYVPYIVRRGETLIGLARRLQTTPDVLRQLNHLRDDNIKAGQRIRVPRPAPVDSGGVSPDSVPTRPLIGPTLPP
ncbi:MAG: LysM peptidoglycan-binding domain-containing protein [Gemmatimonas sp.]